MSATAREHWDRRYADGRREPLGSLGPPPVFGAYADVFPTSGSAFEVACGRGRASAWLASRGMRVWGVDISPVAVELAGEYARSRGLADRCRFTVHDLDDGLPAGEPVDLVLCHLFRDADIYTATVGRLKPGGLLAVACLSEVGNGPGEFRAKPGELTDAFNSINALYSGERDGYAWFIGHT
ncbi:MAG: class I SAM-dependent methyltransferase [Actinomycetota bacterium]|nr:class I SAM-dependent methyltransferase [Actinomycetota bacterium]